ncbi:MAG: MFS transporter [Ignavibacteriales bacterium]|nr:MFS transporter [Ignavibacteriales bacterium]
MKKVRGLRWWIVGLVAAATVVNYIHRSSLSVMWPDISKELGMTKEDYSAIITSFMIFYAIGQSVSGKLFDKIGTRLGFVVSIVVWSVSAGLHSVVSSLAGLNIVRATLGLGEAGNWPGAAKSNAEWFPAKERALAQGIFNAGASLGAVIAAPMVALIYVYLGWKITFVVISLFGLLWIIPWLFMNRATPDKHPWITDEERSLILSDRPKTGAPGEQVLAVRALLGYKQTWAIVVSRFFVDPVWWLFVNWLPIYLAEQFGFNVKEIGYFAWVPYVGAAAGSLLGGWISGHYIGKGWSVNKARKTVIVAGSIVMMPALLASAYAATPIAAVCMIAIVLFGFQVVINNIQTLPSDYFSGANVGMVAGLGGTSAIIGVLITSWLVPAMTKTSYVPFFLLGASLVPLSLIALFSLGGRVQKVEVKKPV